MSWGHCITQGWSFSGGADSQLLLRGHGLARWPCSGPPIAALGSARAQMHALLICMYSQTVKPQV
jgi:hypothetical protein